jgi:hypothetical protein
LRILAFALVLLLGSTTLRSQTQLSQYTFTSGFGSPISMDAPNTIFGNNVDDAVNGLYNIGFPFTFCGNTYNQFSASSNGYMGLGGIASNQLSGGFSWANVGTPVLAGFWRDCYTANGDVTYQVTGTAPNRILVVQWRVNACCAGGNPGSTFQIHLYESGNMIEFWYGTMGISCGQIGAQMNTSNYAGISGSSNTVSYTSDNSCSNPPAPNTVYTLSPCITTITGIVPQGGTLLMANQDSLMQNITVQRGNSGVYTPFTITGPTCGTSTFNLALSGPNAADYQIASTATTTSGGTATPSITFTPSGVGVRTATLQITGPSNFNRTYTLMANASPRIRWAGDLAQGGTLTLVNGDTLLRSIAVPRGGTMTLTPITLTNINPNGAIPAAGVTYQIRGISGGQYSIAPSSASLASGQSSTPVITFSPRGFGVILDSLIVVADGETRAFPLQAISQTAIATFRIDGKILDAKTILYSGQTGCVGDGLVTYQINVQNSGLIPLNITSASFYKLDGTRGATSFPPLHDAQGNLVPSRDYAVTANPPAIPLSADGTVYPITIDPGASRTIYLTFVAEAIDRRFARLYLRTNAANLSNTDTNGTTTEGLLTFELRGEGAGSHLAGTTSGAVLPTITFKPIRIGDNATLAIPLTNVGQCQLRIALNSIRPVTGDIKEFTVIKAPSAHIDPMTNDVLIPPGASDTIIVGFTPLHVGSRRATMALETNDSTAQIAGITRKGVYTIDMFGTGKADLYAQDADFGTALIGGGVADQAHAPVRMKNSLNVPVVIAKILIDGVDNTEFAEDGGAKWPALPLTLSAGQDVVFNVVFAPAAGGQVGPRNATMKLITDAGDTIVANLTGIAGTRNVTVNPSVVNFGTVSAGKFLRRTIEITNTGTMPMILQPAAPLGTASDFNLNPRTTMTLAPGQTEQVEITYAPKAQGTASTLLTFPSNAANVPGGLIQVTLNGSATRTRRGDIDPSSQTAQVGHGSELTGTTDDGGIQMSLSGVTDVEAVTGMKLWQSVPNPSHDRAEIRYSLARATDIRLELYDGAGRLVKVLDAGMHQAGEQSVTVDVHDLASGLYHYRLTSASGAISRTMTVAH